MATEINMEADNHDSLDVCFDFHVLPEEYKKDNIYMYEWYKSDGEWVEKGKPLYKIRIGEYFGVASFLSCEPFNAHQSGILQQKKNKDELIQPEDIIYTIHPKGMYTFENTPSKESYCYYFDKYHFQEKYHWGDIKIQEWHKQDGDFIKIGELILTLSHTTSSYKEETINLYAEKEGYLDKARIWDDVFKLEQNELVYIIHEKDENRIKRKFKNVPDIVKDDFTGRKIIKWKQVGSFNNNAQGIISKSTDNKLSFIFSLNNIDEKDFIVFQFSSKEIMLSKGDIVSFLFKDNRVINFNINSSSYKSSHQFDKLFENKIQITEDELQHFENQQFIKWKIILKKHNQEIIGGNQGHKQYSSYNNLVIVINKFAKEYRELVRTEIIDYKPLLDRESLSSVESLNAEECYVYLMIDTNNHYHKIGISNKPEWREKTLQSEKPTVELIASKKFVRRKIASSFEKALHETYSSKRIRGEWFQLDATDVSEIKTTLDD